MYGRFTTQAILENVRQTQAEMDKFLTAFKEIMAAPAKTAAGA